MSSSLIARSNLYSSALPDRRRDFLFSLPPRLIARIKSNLFAGTTAAAVLLVFFAFPAVAVEAPEQVPNDARVSPSSAMAEHIEKLGVKEDKTTFLSADEMESLRVLYDGEGVSFTLYPLVTQSETAAATALEARAVFRVRADSSRLEKTGSVMLKGVEIILDDRRGVIRNPLGEASWIFLRADRASLRSPLLISDSSKKERRVRNTDWILLELDGNVNCIWKTFHFGEDMPNMRLSFRAGRLKVLYLPADEKARNSGKAGAAVFFEIPKKGSLVAILNSQANEGRNFPEPGATGGKNRTLASADFSGLFAASGKNGETLELRGPVLLRAVGENRPGGTAIFSAAEFSCNGTLFIRHQPAGTVNIETASPVTLRTTRGVCLAASGLSAELSRYSPAADGGDEAGGKEAFKLCVPPVSRWKFDPAGGLRESGTLRWAYMVAGGEMLITGGESGWSLANSEPEGGVELFLPEMRLEACGINAKWVSGKTIPEKMVLTGAGVKSGEAHGSAGDRLSGLLRVGANNGGRLPGWTEKTAGVTPVNAADFLLDMKRKVEDAFKIN